MNAAAFFHTIRFRLAIWYAATLAIHLAVLGGAVYGVVRYRLVRHHDDALRQAAVTVAGVLDQRDDCDGPTDAQQAAIDRIGHIVLFQQVDGRAGVLLRSAHHPATVIDVDYQRPAFPLPSKAWYATTYRAPDRVRTYSQPYRSRAGREVLIRVFQRLGDVMAPLASLRFVLLLIAPLAVIASAFGGYWLAGRALNPIDQITRTARAIEASRLDERLPASGSSDEIGRLIETFNQMIARLQASFENMKRFTADASHELRGPLKTMQGAIDVVLARPRGAEEYQAVLAGLGDDVHRLRSMTEDLLVLASADASRVKLETAPLRLDVAAAEVASSFGPAAESGRIDLVTDCAQPVLVLGDERWIRQLIVNLLDNAIKFTAAAPRRGERAWVRVNVHTANGTARLDVADSGPGIPEEAVARVFERFYRVDQARPYRDSGGFGLGLSIAAWITEAHRGTITVQQRPQGGTVLSVGLPLLRR